MVSSHPTEDENAVARLAAGFRNLGASEQQAGVMASQTLKRARQLAAQRQIPEHEALAELLGKIIAGVQGNYTGEP